MKNELKQYLAKIGKKGGESTKEKYGPDYFKKISKLGVAKRNEQKR